MKLKIRPDMIFSAVVHLDEKTPHLHLCFVPLTDDNRLTAKEILGNRAKLSKWQDEFHEYMAEFYPDLERGTSATLTNRKHIPSYIFKSAAKLEKMQAEIERLKKQLVFETESAYDRGIKAAVKSLKEKKTTLKFNTSVSPMIVEESATLYLILPVRIPEKKGA